jgi:hypothetical protein
MKTVAYEGVVERGTIRLQPPAKLPENTRVYVLVPGDETATEGPTPQIRGPRLVNPADYEELRKVVIEDSEV